MTERSYCDDKVVSCFPDEQLSSSSRGKTRRHPIYTWGRECRARNVQTADFGSVVGASRVVTARHQSQSPRNHQRIGAAGRRIRGERRRSFPFRVPLPRCCGRTSRPAAGTRQRHIAAANMSAVTSAVGIVVSESSLVRLFCHGQLVGEIIPEVWMLDHAHLGGAAKREQVGELTILTPSLGQTPSAK